MIEIINKIRDGLDRDYDSPKEGVDELLRTIGNLKLRYKDAAIYEALCWELLTIYKRLKSCERKLKEVKK
jgi:hypothetical protein